MQETSKSGEKAIFWAVLAEKWLHSASGIVSFTSRIASFTTGIVLLSEAGVRLGEAEFMGQRFAVTHVAVGRAQGGGIPDRICGLRRHKARGRTPSGTSTPGVPSCPSVLP